MKPRDITPITMEQLVRAHHLPGINYELAYLDTLKRLPEIATARRMSLCIFMAVCTEGVASVCVNGRKRIISRSNIVLITDESVVDSVNPSPDFDGIGIFLSYNMLQEVLKDINNMSGIFLLTHNHPHFEITPDELDTVLTCLRLIRKRIDTTGHKYRLEVVRQLVLTMVSDLRDAFDRLQQGMATGERQSRAGHIFVEYIKLVERNYKQQRQVQWYAAMINISPKYLCEAITAVSRRSPNEWIDKFVTTEIRNQLRHTDKRISEIAKEMNFPTQSFFGKYFKENVGVSPTEYRNGIEL